MKGLVFEKMQKTAQHSKQEHLKKQSKGNRPNASLPIPDDEIAILYEKKEIGTSSDIKYGVDLRGIQEHHRQNMQRGDVQLKKNDQGFEYLEFNERQKRTGDITRNVRPSCKN